jgi:hypothetical protein
MAQYTHTKLEAHLIDGVDSWHSLDSQLLDHCLEWQLAVGQSMKHGAACIAHGLP